MQFRIKSFFAAVLITCLAACGGSNSGGADDNILRRGTASEPASLDPQIANGQSASAIINDLFVGLMASDAKGKTVGGIAESYAVSEDGKSYTFKLRPDLKWSDGEPLTSSDIVWSFQRLMSPETGARYASNLYVLKNGRLVNTGKVPVESLGVAAPDPQTVVFELERRVPYFPRILLSNATAPLPQHVVSKYGRDWTKPGNIVSNGAFVLKEWVPNTRILMTKNDLFFDAENVKLAGVEYFPTDNTGTLVKRYRAGELDIVLNFPPEQLELLKRSFGEEVHSTTNYGLNYYLFNNKKPPFDDVRVRKALSIAVDRKGIVDKILSGEAEPAWTMVPSDISDYKRIVSPDASRSQADREKEAKALLAEAGFNATNPLQLDIRYDTKEESRQIAIAIASMWKDIGVEAELSASDFRGITSDSRSGNFDVIRYQWFAPYDDPSTFLSLLSGRSATNLSGYNSPAYDALVASADDIVDVEKRMEQLARAEQAAMKEYPVLPIYFSTARRLVSSKVVGWSDFPGGNVQSRFLSLK